MGHRQDSEAQQYRRHLEESIRPLERSDEGRLESEEGANVLNHQFTVSHTDKYPKVTLCPEQPTPPIPKRRPSFRPLNDMSLNGPAI